MTTQNNWYEAKSGTHQGLIVDEKTGANIAVSYNMADAVLIAAAPELLAACKAALKALDRYPEPEETDQIASAIFKAEGGAE